MSAMMGSERPLNSHNNKKKKRKSRRKWKKKNKLCTEDLDFLLEETNFSSQEIREWYK